MTKTTTNSKTKKILLNAFDMNCVGHINHGCGLIRGMNHTVLMN